MRFCVFFVGLGVLIRLVLAQQLTSVIVDDQSPLIRYVPSSSWTEVEGSNWDSGSGHLVTEDPDAYAEISYTFVSFHYLSAKYPYEIKVDLSVEGVHYATVDLQDYDSTDDGSGAGTVPSVVVASYNGTSSRNRTIRVSMASEGGYAVVDAFIFDVELISTSISTSPTPTSTLASTTNTTTPQSTSSTPSTSSTTAQQVSTGDDSESAHRRARNLAIALGVVCPILALLILILLWRRLVKKRQRNSGPLVPNASIPNYHGDGHDGRSPAMTEAGAYSSTRSQAGLAGSSTIAPSAYKSPFKDDNAESSRARRMSLHDAALSVVGGPSPSVVSAMRKGDGADGGWTAGNRSS